MRGGGITALVELNRTTKGALAADILERLHVPLRQAHLIGWGEILNWASHLGEDSHTYAALHPDHVAPRVLIAEYAACIADAVAMLNFNFARRGKGKRPEPIFRPWKKPKAQKVGKEPIPIRDFESWYYGGD